MKRLKHVEKNWTKHVVLAEKISDKHPNTKNKLCFVSFWIITQNTKLFCFKDVFIILMWHSAFTTKDSMNNKLVSFLFVDYFHIQSFVELFTKSPLQFVYFFCSFFQTTSNKTFFSRSFFLRHKTWLWTKKWIKNILRLWNNFVFYILIN